MANLKEVKNRIQSVHSTQQITKAMKMVAAAKLRKAQDGIMQMRPYSQKLTSIIHNITSSVDEETLSTPYSTTREVNRVLLIVESSDRGLCGAFNSNIFKYAKSVIAEKYPLQEVTLMPIGRKAVEHFQKRGFDVMDDYGHLFHRLNFEDARRAAEDVMEMFLQGEFDRVEFIYNEFKNVATQIVRLEQFLPIQKPKAEKKQSDDLEYIFEPDQQKLFEEIVPKSLKIQFYKTLLESNASENGARMTAMDQATDNAEELLKQLRLTYNRTRQAAITKEILEIDGGAEPLNN
jgi:F-type H+-transporting ATPase subunit gamma